MPPAGFFDYQKKSMSALATSGGSTGALDFSGLGAGSGSSFGSGLDTGGAGGGSSLGGFDWNSFAGDAVGSLGGIFTGIANLVNASKGNPTQYVNPTYPGSQQNPTTQPPANQGSGISATTIIVMVVLLVLLIAVAYFLFKK